MYLCCYLVTSFQVELERVTSEVLDLKRSHATEMAEVQKRHTDALIELRGLHSKECEGLNDQIRQVRKPPSLPSAPLASARSAFCRCILVAKQRVGATSPSTSPPTTCPV